MNDVTLGRHEARRLRDPLYPEKRRADRRRYRQNLRTRVFAHYGTSCACCGTADDLTIDHVNGDGAAQRAELGPKGVGQHFYHWLVVNGFPPGYQTLCEPCNQSKARKAACTLDHAEKSLIAC